MASLAEVLNTISIPDYLHDPVQFIIDEDLRTVAIHPKGIIIGVVGDKNTNRVNFSMPRYYNGFDMSEFTTVIKYVNANNESGYYTVTDLTIEDSDILFTWLVDEKVTNHSGTVRFVVNMIKKVKGEITQSFNSAIATGSVLEGLEVPIEPEPDGSVPSVSELVCFNSITGDVVKVTSKEDMAWL